jgi:murein DD-endopeptidase MepM/ murein hydrolase activator NlpD
LVHAKSLVPAQQEVSAGQAVAYIYGAGELPIGSCWGGPHIHLEIRHNGEYIDPPSFLQAMGCNVPDESQCYE